MPIVCYADESGTHDASGMTPGSEVVVVSGYVGWKHQWDAFTPLWLKVLDRYHVPVFHLSEMVKEGNCKKAARECGSAFHGWDQVRRDTFIRELIPIAREHNVFAVTGAVDVQAYNRIIPHAVRQRYGHPYHVAFQQLFSGMLVAMVGSPYPEGERIAFFFDQQDNFKHHAMNVYDEVRANLDVHGRFGGISFEDKAHYIPLQAADLLAGRTRKTMTRLIKAGQWSHAAGGWDAELARRGNHFLRYSDAPVLEQIAARLRENGEDT